MEETITEENHPDIENIDDIHTEDTTPENQNDFEYLPEKERKGRKLPFIIGIVIGLIIGIIISPYVLIIDTFNEKPIYQEYEKYEGEDKIVYNNEMLEVSITMTPYSYSESGYYYEAEWTNKNGYQASELNLDSSVGLYDEILEVAEGLSGNQLKWFEYMLKNVVK